MLPSLLQKAAFLYIVVGMSLRELVRSIVLICVFITPFICLFVADNMFFPFITGKNFTFRILTEIMFGAWGILMFLDAKYRPRFSWVLGAVTAFIVVIAIADFHGVNPYRSFWSNYERMEGLITHIHLFLYFLVAGSVIVSEKIWEWLWRTTLAASVIVDLFYAIPQIAGLAESHGRLDATFGNASYLSIFSMFNIFLAAFLFLRSKDRSWWTLWIYPAVALLNLVILFYTQTRGTILGLLAGGALAFLLFAIFDKQHPKLKRYAIGGILAIIALVAVFIPLRHSAWVQSVPTLSRLAAISVTDTTTSSRFMIWQMSWEGFKERPLLGWGQDNFLYVFSKHYNPKMWNQEPWFDRSHDVFFDWLIAGGALGLLAYLSMFAALIYYLWFAKKQHFSVAEKSIFTGMLAGYFVHNIFVFDNLTSYIVFFSLLAYIHSQYTEEPKAEAAPSKMKKGDALESGDVAIAGVFIVLATIGMVYFVNIRNVSANLALINAIRPDGVLVDDGHGTKKIALEDVIQQNLFGTDEAREQLAQFAVQTLDPRIPADVRKQFYETTADELDASLKDDPENARTHSFAATFYARFGQNDKALQHFGETIRLSPSRQSNYLDLSMLYISMGQYQESENTAKKAYDLEPGNGNAGVAYATALIYNKKADQALALVKTLGDSGLDTRIVNAFGAAGFYDKVVELENERIARGIATGRDYFSLAGGLASLGKKAEAIAAVQKGVSVDSSLKDQGEQVIKQIEAGKSVTK